MNKDKIRDMIRSILPSTARSTQAEKAQRHRKTRRTVRMDLRREDDDKVDLRRTTDVRDIVLSRRAADKLNHFMRWCETLTDGMSKEEALGFVRALLPKNLIGDHAYGHWEDHLDRHRGTGYSFGEGRMQSFLDSTTFRLRRALMVDPTLHARLNAAIKEYRSEKHPVRLLAGVHDVEAFVRDIACGGIERKLTLQLIEQIEKQKGGRKAALRICGRTLPACTRSSPPSLPSPSPSPASSATPPPGTPRPSALPIARRCARSCAPTGSPATASVRARARIWSTSSRTRHASSSAPFPSPAFRR